MDYSEMKATKESRSDKMKNLAKSAAAAASTVAVASAASKSAKKRTSTAKKSTSKSGTSRSTSSKSSSSRSSSSSSSKSKTSSASTKKSNTSSSNKLASVRSSGSSSSAKSSGGYSTSAGGARKVVKKSEQKPKKNLEYIGWIIVAACLVIGIIGGFFVTKSVCKNDIYEMIAYENGEYDITIGENEDVNNYIEMGVKCISFGKDYSPKYSVTYYYRNDLTKDEVKVDKVDVEKDGIYYAVYSVPAAKYKTVKLIRNIIVLRGDSHE